MYCCRLLLCLQDVLEPATLRELLPKLALHMQACLHKQQWCVAAVQRITGKQLAKTNQQNTAVTSTAAVVYGFFLTPQIQPQHQQ
jgi:hypothetical protein